MIAGKGAGRHKAGRKRDRSDRSNWREPKLAADGLMAGHDYGHPDYPGVKQAVHEFAEQQDLMLHAAPDFVRYLETPS